MKSVESPPAKETPALTPVQRGLVAAQTMAKELEAEHKRWNMPLLTWKDGKVIAVKP